MASRIEIEKFILEKYTSLTAADIAAKFLLDSSHVIKICRKLGVMPVQVKERNQIFILDNHKSMSATQVAARLGITRKTLLALYGTPLGIKFKKEEDGEKIETLFVEAKKAKAEKNKRPENNLTPRAILANYSFGPGHHYHHPEADPIEEERKKLRKEFKDKL